MHIPLDEKSLNQKAIYLLSRREYSRTELFQRLEKYAVSLEILNLVLDSLVLNGYQSDKRFTDSFVRQRVQRYWGPKRIEYELVQKGISKSLIDETFAQMSPDWIEIARALARKRFSNSHASSSAKEYAKQTRYMLNHGFNYDQIKTALDFEFE